MIPFLTFWVLGTSENLNINFNFNFLDCYYRSNFLSLILVYIPTVAPEIAFKDIFTYLLAGSNEDNLLASLFLLSLMIYFIYYIKEKILNKQVKTQ